MGKFEKESFARFCERIPKNPYDWDGTVVLYAAQSDVFYNVAFGSGDNLDDDDCRLGFDDYIMVDQFKPDGTRKHDAIMRDILDSGWISDEIEGLEEADGGQLLLKRKQWTDGDIRRFVALALDFAGYGTAKKKDWLKDVVFIAADWEVS